MNFARIARQTEKLLADNSPIILTAIGVAGTVTTAVFAHNAGIQAHQRIVNEHVRKELMSPETGPIAPLTNKEKVKLTWKLYLPAIGSGATTVACIIFANRIGNRRAAAMAAAFSLSEKASTEYREKIIEKFTENKERQVRDEIAQDKVRAQPESSQLIVLGNGEVLCFDAPNERTFSSDMETIRRVQNDINQQIIEVGEATLQEFYVSLNLPPTAYSEEVGWSSRIGKMLEIKFSSVLTDKNQPCLSINYTFSPLRGYNQDPPF